MAEHKDNNVEGTHLGVDAWLETADAPASSQGFVPAARILAGEEPNDDVESTEEPEQG
ncbi:hypothetical protein [Timonella sp. A28]|uniref:hypothetical protein n=1 Tax=Timonella sp. A28 TaxID=3442640 RepID=UPI003EBB7F98